MKRHDAKNRHNERIDAEMERMKNKRVETGAYTLHDVTLHVT